MSPVAMQRLEQLDQYLNGIQSEDMEGSIEIMRGLSWTERNAYKGVSDQSLYMTQMSINLLAWMIPDSPMRLLLAGPEKQKIPQDYLEKHSEWHHCGRSCRKCDDEDI